MRVVAIIQARMGSSRLPRKVLHDLGGRTMLDRVVRRVARAERIDEVVVATTIKAADEPIVRECGRMGVACFRGSEEDVLDRYHQTAEAFGADVIVRVTSDCPLIDPGVTARVLDAFLDMRPDYASNILSRTYPRGLDTEVAGSAALARAWRRATEPYQRVHVMPYLYQHPEEFLLLPVIGQGDFSGRRWTVDTAEDLEFVRAVYERLDNEDTFSWRDVLQVLEDEPALADLNRHVRQKQFMEG